MITGTCASCRGRAIKDGNKHWPFCSERCQLVDLGQWLNEAYRIPDASDGPAPLHTEPPDDER